MYGCLATPWHTSTYIRDPYRPFHWEIVWRSDEWGQRCRCMGNEKTRRACQSAVEALLTGLQEPLATRIWCDSNVL